MINLPSTISGDEHVPQVSLSVTPYSARTSISHTILPVPTVRREVEAGLLRAIPFSDVQWMRPLGSSQRRQKALPTAVRKFIELLTGTGSAPATAAAVLVAEGSVAVTAQDVQHDVDGSSLKRIAEQV